MKLILTFIGCDSWSRPVYETNGKLYVDVDPCEHLEPSICTKCDNEFDGEPDWPVEAEFEFVPCRITW